MEIELKYIIKDKEQIQSIFLFLEEYGYINKKDIKIKQLKATYYDTNEMDLQKNKMALRKRKEDNEIFATLKWGGNEEGGLHKREEINESLNNYDENYFDWRKIFEKYTIAEQLETILKGKELISLFQTDIIREVVVISLEKVKIEFVYDKGDVIGSEKREAVREIELELLSGEEESLIEFGNLLVEKFHVSPSAVTKFERGLKVI